MGETSYHIKRLKYTFTIAAGASSGSFNIADQLANGILRGFIITVPDIEDINYALSDSTSTSEAIKLLIPTLLIKTSDSTVTSELVTGP